MTASTLASGIERSTSSDSPRSRDHRADPARTSPIVAPLIESVPQHGGGGSGRHARRPWASVAKREGEGAAGRPARRGRGRVSERGGAAEKGSTWGRSASIDSVRLSIVGTSETTESGSAKGLRRRSQKEAVR